MNKISDKDKKAWQKFVSSKEKILDKDKHTIKEEPLFIEKSIDLHGYSLDQANNLIEKTIIDCDKVGVRELKIITNPIINKVVMKLRIA